MRKTYYLINLKESNIVDDGIYENTLPPEFVDAKGEKYIEVRYCYATFDNYLVADVVLTLYKGSLSDHSVLKGTLYDLNQTNKNKNH